MAFPYDLREQPGILAFRVEVVEAGPLSVGLLPIPADRVRSEPLPGDLVEVTPWVVSETGEWPLEDLDLAWFLCPPGACLSTLRQPGAGEPCGEFSPKRLACRLSSDDVVRLSAPQLDPSEALFDQTSFRIAVIGHWGEGSSTESCVEGLVDLEHPRWDGCIAGHRTMNYGPVNRWYTEGLRVFGSVDEVEIDPELLNDFIAPHFNPEPVPLRLVPLFEGRLSDQERSVAAAPYQVTQLEPGYVYNLTDVSDPRDAQFVVGVYNMGEVRGPFDPEYVPYTDTPGTLDYLEPHGWLLRPTEENHSFNIYFVLRDAAGGVTWAVYPFEVRSR